MARKTANAPTPIRRPDPWHKQPEIHRQYLYNDHPNVVTGFISGVFARGLMRETAHRRYYQGTVVASRKSILFTLRQHDWQVFLDSTDHDDGQGQIACVREDGALMVQWHNETTISATVASTDKALADTMLGVFKTWVNNAPARGQVFVLGTSGDKLALMPLGTTNSPFQPENYGAEARAAFAAAVRELTDATPNGRLTVLDGPPGTGKSFYVRGLIHAVEKAQFVLVPADMVSQLGHPQFIPTLLRKKENMPIVVVLEDADEALVKRMGDNISSIAALLNLADGIFGELLDVRVIATTNARKLELEPAMMRQGRLSQHIHVGELSPDEAFAALQKLLPNETLVNNPFFKPVILADVYRAARALGWASPPPTSKAARQPRSLGFHPWEDDYE